MVKYADRMNEMKASDVRELLKLTARPEVISFAGGMPAPELFPVDDVNTATAAVLHENGRAALQYGPTEGYLPLRKQIADRLAAKNGIHTDADHIMITAGSQQGLDYCARLFLNPGDVVVMESPSYLGAISAFKPCQPKFVEVPTDDGGMIMEELDRILATTENVKMIYVIPDFQNPSGRTWSLERRKAFMEVVNKYEVPVIEDNPYGELRFKGEFLAQDDGHQGSRDLPRHLLQDPRPRLPSRLDMLRLRHIRQDDAHRAGRRASDRNNLHDGRLQVPRHVRS